MNSFRLILLILLFLIVAVAIWLLGPEDAPPVAVPRVILISIDTCRADRLSCYGYRTYTTPYLDALAEESLLFTHALAPSPLTRPSHATMLTGANPPYHGVHANGFSWLGKSNFTLPERLAQHGYPTAAIVSTFVMDSQFQLDQGFDTYDDDFDPPTAEIPFPERTGDQATQLACQWLTEHQKGPFFLFLHYYDPHDPYEPPEPFDSQFPNDPYVGEIAFTDHCIGRVIERLKSLDLYDSTLLIVTSDHGESMGEHGELTHAFFIYQSVIHVPLIVKPARQIAGCRVDQVVGLVDIAPTILNHFDLPLTRDLVGIDLLSFLAPEPTTSYDRYLYSESLLPIQYQANPLLAVTTDRWKYIDTTRPELYDLRADPSEAKNLLAGGSSDASSGQSHRQIAGKLQDRLRSIITQQTRSSPPDSGDSLDDLTVTPESPATLDNQTIARLESLGYTAGAPVTEVLEIDPSRDDPKDLIDFHQQKILIKTLIEQKLYGQAREVCGRLLTGRTNPALAHRMLGQISYIAGDLAEAAASYARAVELDRGDYLAHNNLATTLYQMGNIDAALEHWRQAIKINPKGHLARINLGQAFLQQKMFDQAIEQWQQLLALDERQASVHKNLGQVFMQARRVDQAIKHWGRALELEPSDLQLHHFLGLAYYQQKQVNKAVTHWEKLLASRPDEVAVLNNLAWILATHKNAARYDPDRAVELAQRAAKLAGQEHPGMLDILAAAYAATGRFDEAIAAAQKAYDLAKTTPNL